MKLFKDYHNRTIRLTTERQNHILEHPEMNRMLKYIPMLLADPEIVIRSASDSKTVLYYQYFLKSPVGNKYLCIVVKHQENDAFILTAYLTDTIKKGETIWLRKE